jgi:sugar phosphate isomerase/epimerase
MQTRRNFLATLGVAALGIASGDAAAASAIAAPRRKLKRIGMQLYTVRGMMETDVPGTLAKVAAIGYKEVEFAGYFGHTPAQIRELLRRNRLDSPSTHFDFVTLDTGWQQRLDDARKIGHRWAIIAFIPEELRPRTVDDWKRLAGRFNRAAAQAKSAGLRFAYHNHEFEIQKLGNVRPLDVLLQETDPSLVDFEMDLYWVVNAGGNPIEFFDRHPKRFKLFHVKDSAGPPDHKIVDVGKGTIDFRSIFARSDKAGVKHYFVEHDEPTDPIATLRNSYNYLQSLTF